MSVVNRLGGGGGYAIKTGGVGKLHNQWVPRSFDRFLAKAPLPSYVRLPSSLPEVFTSPEGEGRGGGGHCTSSGPPWPWRKAGKGLRGVPPLRPRRPGNRGVGLDIVVEGDCSFFTFSPRRRVQASIACR